MTTWFTSDIHFCHRNILRLCDRPFDDIDEMNEAIISNFNSVVKPEDTLYILGDINFRGNADHLIPRLNGHKILIKGNHDKDFDASLFDEVCDYLDIKVPAKGKHYRFILSHYPFEEWNGFYKGAIHLHGHQHNKSVYNEKMRSQNILRYDVGVDANNFYPISAAQIASFFKLS